LHGAADADDRGRHRPRLHARPLRGAGRSGRPRDLGGPYPAQAVRRLDLGRLPPDGGGRRPGCLRPPLPAGAPRAGDAGGGASERSSGHMKRSLLPLALFLGLLALLGVGLRMDPGVLPSPLVGKPAPAFKLALLHGPARTLANQDMAGQVWLLSVWASWCTACGDEHPVLMRLAASGAVPVLGLNYKDERGAGLAWLERHGNPYAASAFDADGATGIDYGVY